MSALVLSVFCVVYAGMVLGRLPRLMLDRSGVALLGAIVLVAAGAITLEEGARAIDVPTVALLFGLMIVSAQLRLGGFYTVAAQWIAKRGDSPSRLLLLVTLLSGGFAMVLTNDIVCFAVAPVLIEACARRRLDPVPFLLALAAGANVGSAATLIGNPQNILVGQRLQLPFGAHLAVSLVPALLGLVVVWGVLARQTRGAWERETVVPEASAPPYNRWQTTKGALIAVALVGGFLLSPWPREALALGAAGVLLMSRRTASRDIVGLIDWPLLVLFAGLFVVNDALGRTGLPEQAVTQLADRGVHLASPPVLFVVVTLLSNLVSNVPAVMLLLPVATHPIAGPLMTLASTLAGNLLVVGSIANIIVIDAAATSGIAIGWRRHARMGLPVTLLTLAIAAVWLWIVDLAGLWSG